MKSINVWDPFVRVFHWALVITVIAQLITGEDYQNVHTLFGYFLICLVLARIIWGFIGTKHARFNDFLYRPGEIIGYLTSLIGTNPKHFMGHNPVGGLMVVVLIISLLATAFSGLKALAAEGKGPLANSQTAIAQIAYADEDEHEENGEELDSGGGRRYRRDRDEFWEEIHESLVNFVIFLIIVHVLGVVVSSWIHKENLILAMITGKKQLKPN